MVCWLLSGDLACLDFRAKTFGVVNFRFCGLGGGSEPTSSVFQPLCGTRFSSLCMPAFSLCECGALLGNSRGVTRNGIAGILGFGNCSAVYPKSHRIFHIKKICQTMAVSLGD